MNPSGVPQVSAQVFVDGIPMSTISAMDRGLAYGDGLFETCRMQAGRVPLLEHHVARLCDGLSRLFIALPEYELRRQITVAIDAATQVSGTLKIIVTRGSGGRGYGMPATVQPCVITLFTPDDASPFTDNLPPAKLWLCSLRLGINPAIAGLKHLSRLENVLARAESDKAGADEGLLLDSNGCVIECTAHNVFLLKDNVLLTPQLNGAGVHGVMRHLILYELAPALGLAVKEVSVSLDELGAAEEVFICNSNRGIRHVKEITSAVDAMVWDRASWPCVEALQKQLSGWIG